MDPQQIALVKASFVEAQALPESLARVFYERLFAAAPELQSLFAGDPDLLAAEAFTASVEESRRRGDQRSATANSNRAHALAQDCEGAQTPGLVQTDAVVPLSKREREVALLAGQGLSSKDIAAQLFLSVPTVDNHLQRAYTKLGVTNRTELAAALDRAV